MSESSDSGPIPWLDDEQQVSWRSFLEGSARLTEALNRDLDAESQLSLHEYEVLVRLSENPRPHAAHVGARGHPRALRAAA